MKYLDEYRDKTAVQAVLNEIRRVTTRPWTIMEICGGQTHSIIRNGLEAIGTGGELTIASGIAGDQIEIVVSDDGKGMSPEELEHLFTPFYTTKAVGTGLGLAYAQQVVLEHGGEIRCESTPGQRTTFTITLPLPDAK